LMDEGDVVGRPLPNRVQDSRPDWTARPSILQQVAQLARPERFRGR
jgi:hypothetical protein